MDVYVLRKLLILIRIGGIFMTIPQFMFDYSLYIIFAIYLIYIVIGMIRGFVLQVIDLVGLLVGIIISWLLSSSVSKFYMFIPDDLIEYSQYLTTMVQPFLNRIVWFFILLIVIMIIITLLKPLIKAITDLPVLKVIDRVLGSAIGILMATILLIVISGILSTPIFANGREFVEESELQYVKDLSDESLQYLFDNYITDDNLEKFFDENGFDFNIVDFFEDSDITSLLQDSEDSSSNSEDDTWKDAYQKVIDDYNLPISVEDLKKVVDYDFTDAQIQKLIDDYDLDLKLDEIKEIIETLRNNY